MFAQHYILAKPMPKCLEVNPRKCARDLNEKISQNIKRLERDEESIRADEVDTTQSTTTESPTSTKTRVMQLRVTFGCDDMCQKRILLHKILCQRRRTCKYDQKMMKKYFLFSSMSLASLEMK